MEQYIFYRPKKILSIILLFSLVFANMPAELLGNSYLAPPQVSGIPNLLNHSNKDDNSVQSLHDKIEIHQDKKRLALYGKVPNLIDAKVSEEAIRGFFLQNKYSNTEKLLKVFLKEKVNMSDIEKITVREFQKGKYMAIFKTEIYLSNGDICSFTLNIPLKHGKVNESAIDDYKNIEHYNEKYPDIVVKPLIFDRVNISNMEFDSHNVFALEWLGDFVELIPWGKRFRLNPFGRNGEKISKYQILPEIEENHSSILSEVVKLLVQMTEYYPGEDKIDYIHNVNLTAGDFMFRPLDNDEFELKLITIRSIERKKDVEDLLDILLGSRFVEITGSKAFDIQAIFKGIYQGLTARHGESKGAEIYKKWVNAYTRVLSVREKNLSRMIESNSTLVRRERPDIKITQWLRKHSSERQLTNTRFTQKEREIIRKYLDSGKEQELFLEIIKNQINITKQVLNNIETIEAEEFIRDFGIDHKVVVYEVVLDQITSNRLDAGLSERVQFVKKMHPTSESISKGNRESRAHSISFDNNITFGISTRDGVCELGIAEELIPGRLELYAVVSDNNTFSGNIRTARAAGKIIVVYLSSVFNPNLIMRNSKITEKFIIRHLVTAICKANKALSKSEKFGDVCVTASLVWYLSDGSKRIITINQGNNQVYLRSDGDIKYLTIKNLPDKLKNNTATIGDEKYVFVNLNRPIREDLRDLLEEQSIIDNYCTYTGQSDGLWDQFKMRIVANNTVGSNEMLPVVYKKTIRKGSSAELIIASRGVADVLTADEIRELSSAEDMVRVSYERSSSFLELDSLGLFKYGEIKLEVFLESYKKDIKQTLKLDDSKWKFIVEEVKHLGSVMIDVMSMAELYRVDMFMKEIEESGFKIPDEILDELNIMREILSRPNVIRAFDEADCTVLIAEIPQNRKQISATSYARNVSDAHPVNVSGSSGALTDKSM